MTQSSIYQLNKESGMLEFVTNISYRSKEQLVQRLGKKAEGKIFREFEKDYYRAFTLQHGKIEEIEGDKVPASHHLPAAAWY